MNGSPLGPIIDCPLAPSSPLILWNSNAKDGSSAVPVLTTFTDGVPVLLSTVAVAEIVGVAPVGPGTVDAGPVAPSAPFKFEKLKDLPDEELMRRVNAIKDIYKQIEKIEERWKNNE